MTRHVHVVGDTYLAAPPPHHPQQLSATAQHLLGTRFLAGLCIQLWTSLLIAWPILPSPAGTVGQPPQRTERWCPWLHHAAKQKGWNNISGPLGMDKLQPGAGWCPHLLQPLPGSHPAPGSAPEGTFSPALPGRGFPFHRSDLQSPPSSLEAHLCNSLRWVWHGDGSRGPLPVAVGGFCCFWRSAELGTPGFVRCLPRNRYRDFISQS